MPTCGMSFNRGAPMPNLENLRKQAKLILRWHRDRYYPVAVQIRSGLPRFHGMSDKEILSADFKLSDAQELVARQQGFESWQALKAGIGSLPEHAVQRPPAATITATAAQLFVADIQASCDYFVQKLGFSIVFVYGEPPYFAQVKRDRGLLNLRCVEAPLVDPQLRDREIFLSSDMGVDTYAELKQLFLEFQAAGVDFVQTLRKEPWGASTFIVRDLDGNLLLFAGPSD
jgi:catechol 2,3-dioxygenase-like lactoylglutathione lyase family enzyme